MVADLKKKQILFVDDDAGLLTVFKELFAELSGDRWEIVTAQNHSEALAHLHDRKMDLVVLDIGMPVMDGIQFLKLMNRTHPGQQVVMLTGLASEEKRKICLDLGAVLFLEKPVSSAGYREVFSALDALVSTVPQEGFRGVMRQVGLQDVLQMECLGAKSSILEVFTSKMRGRIYIHDGSIVHAEQGKLQGELALYHLLALRGGGFNLMPFAEPSQRSIQGQWEFLLMEAARLKDEGGIDEAQPESKETLAAAAAAAADFKILPNIPPPKAPVTDEQKAAPAAPAATEKAATPAPAAPSPAATSVAPSGESAGPRTEEIVLCSGAGEVLYNWECKSTEQRVRLFEVLEQQASEVSFTASVGRFDRLEIITDESRIVCQIQLDRRLLVRTSLAKGQP